MARQAHQPPRIGLISPCGGGNLGDAAILAATLEGIRARAPGATFLAMTLNPKDTERRHQISAFRLSAERYVLTGGDFAARGSQQSLRKRLYNVKWLRPFLRNFLRVLYFAANARNELRHVVAGFALARHADLILVAGGGQLDDYWGGAWSHPYNLLKWGCIARAAGTPLALLSVGYGTNPSRLSRLFLRAVLKLSAYSSFRDPRSASIARDRLGHSEPVVVPDLAFGLPVSSPPQPPSAQRMVVGISPIAYADPRWWPRKDAALYDRYLGRLAQFVDWLGAQGHQLIFFCTDTMDVHCLRDLHERCAAPLTAVTTDADRPHPYYKEVSELVAQLARIDLVVASRLHGVILAHRLAKPVLAISYDWKVDVHMAQAGESDNVLDIQTLETATLSDGFRHLADRRAEIERKLRHRATEFAQQVDAQFDRVAERFLLSSVRRAND